MFDRVVRRQNILVIAFSAFFAFGAICEAANGRADKIPDFVSIVSAICVLSTTLNMFWTALAETVRAIATPKCTGRTAKF